MQYNAISTEGTTGECLHVNQRVGGLLEVENRSIFFPSFRC